MKKTLLILLTTIFVVQVYGQDKTSLYGLWKMDYKGSGNELVLQKFVNDANAVGNWGHFIEFHKEGTYIEKSTVPCGLDDNLFTYTGKWTYDTKTKKIELSSIKIVLKRPNIYNNYEVLKSGTLLVLSGDRTSINMKIAKSWEKVSKK